MMTQFSYLGYFLDHYWHEMADEVYGSLEGAAKAFCAESAVFKSGLSSDLKAAVKAGLISSEYADEAYKRSFWSERHRLLNKDDASRIAIVLGSSA